MAIDRKAIKKQASEIEDTRGAGFWKPKPGRYKFRLLDGWPGSNTYFVDIATHYNVGPTKAIITCPRMTSSLAKKSGKKCPVCNKVLDLLGGTEAEKKLGNAMKANVRYLMNIILRPSPTEVGGPKIAQFPKQVHDKIFEFIMNPEDFGEITDPKEGHDLSFRRTGTTMQDTRYDVTVLPKTEPLSVSDKEIKKIQDSATDLTKFIVYEEYDAIVAKMSGEDAEDAEAAEEEEEEEDETETESESDETEEEDTDEEEEEVEAKGSDDEEEVEEKESDDEEEVEEVEEEEDEEEPPPPPKKKKKLEVTSTTDNPVTVKGKLSGLRARLGR